MPEAFTRYDDWRFHPESTAPAREQQSEEASVEGSGKAKFEMGKAPVGWLICASDEPFSLRAEMRPGPDDRWKSAPVLRTVTYATWRRPPTREDSPTPQELRPGNIKPKHGEAKSEIRISEKNEAPLSPPYVGMYSIEPAPEFLRLFVDGSAEVSIQVVALHREDDAPAPRPSPNPFDLATGMATFPTDPATRGNLKGISGEGDWIQDTFGRPVYRYTIEGPPWGGNAQLSVKEAIEAETAWKMLRDGKGEERPAQFHADAVALYLLFLAYAGDQAPESRPGEDGEFRIRGKDVFRVLNLSDGWDLQKKVRHVHDLNNYLNSFQVQLNRVTYEGERKKTDAISPAQLWDTYLRNVQEEDLHGNVTNIEFWVEGQEGAWADLFVHDSDKWTPWGALPIRMIEEMDGRNRFNRLILFRVWVLFRVEKGTVKRTGNDLLKWCRVVPEELSRQTLSRRRRSIMNALEEIKQKGFRIDDSRLRAVKGAPLDDWQAQPVRFYPPEEIVEACPQVQAPEGQLPEPRSEVWTAKRVRALRNHIGDTQGEFGERLPKRTGEIGVKQPRISTIENGPHNLTPRQEEKLDELAEKYGFDG